MVHFVGAGPGSPDLITVRGHRLLSEADVVIYAGSLVNRELLDVCRADCLIHDSAYMTLEEVIEVIRTAEKSGKTTVRLHTGDPSIYGAIREQMDILDAEGIKYDICPGVSSMSGAAAAIKAEYTLPGVSQTLIISRMAGRTSVPDKESIRQLASHQSTMVLFLSAGRLRELTEELIEGGYSPDTPAAIVYKASWPDEIKIRCPLADIQQEAEKAGINRMALIIVGKVLGDEYDRSLLYDPHFTTGFREGYL